MLNFPNFLTIARVLSVPIFLILLINGEFGWALLILVAAAITDAVDGLLARMLHQRTLLGSYLDPIADKVLITSSFITLAILNLVPGWLAVVVVSRDVIISLGFLVLVCLSLPLEVKPSLAGKLTTTFQLLTVIGALFSNWAFSLPSTMLFLTWGTALVTIISCLQYIGKGIRILNQKKI